MAAQTLGDLMATEGSHLTRAASLMKGESELTPDPSPQGIGESDLTPTPTATATLQPTSALGADPASLRGAVVRMWHPWSGEMNAALQELAAEFNASNEWGINVQVESQDNLDDLATQVQSAIQSGEPPDLAVGYLYQALAWEDGRELADLDLYLNDPQWGLSAEEQADFYPLFWEQNSVDGKRVGLPALGSGQVLFYNQSWAQELGFSAPPATAEEFRQQACAAAQASQQAGGQAGTGGWIISTHYSTLLGWIQAFGGQVSQEAGGQTQDSPYNFDTPAVQQAFTFLRGLYDERCAWLAEDIESEQAFALRQGLFATGSLTGIPYQADTMKRLGKGDEWTVIPFPGLPDQAGLSAYGPAFVMLSETPELRLAGWLFLRWLLGTPNQVRLAEAGGSFPLSAGSLTAMQEYRSQNPQWAAAVDLLPKGQAEPAYRSWEMVRWALTDAATQLFRSYFSLDQVPQLVKFLDKTAADLHLHPPGSGFANPVDGFSTPTSTPIPATGTPVVP
jgi:multiple sugar transport system substrate-binding protein